MPGTLHPDTSIEHRQWICNSWLFWVKFILMTTILFTTFQSWNMPGTCTQLPVLSRQWICNSWLFWVNYILMTTIPFTTFQLRVQFVRFGLHSGGQVVRMHTRYLCLARYYYLHMVLHKSWIWLCIFSKLEVVLNESSGIALQQLGDMNDWISHDLSAVLWH